LIIAPKKFDFVVINTLFLAGWELDEGVNQVRVLAGTNLSSLIWQLAAK